MTTLLNTHSLHQLDRELRDLPREHEDALDLDAFRRDLDTADQRPSLQIADPAATPSASRRESQLRQELNLAFTDLGGAAFALAHHGAPNDKRSHPTCSASISSTDNLMPSPTARRFIHLVTVRRPNMSRRRDKHSPCITTAVR